MKSILIKLIIVIGTFVSSQVAVAQCSGCDPSKSKGITTNPEAPINTERPEKTNTFFDWTATTFPINSSLTNDQQIISPFYQDNNSAVSVFLDNKDRLPKDGWELIKYTNGYEDDGNPSPTAVGFVSIVLYNKYTGVLRVMLAGDEVQGFNGARIRVTFDGNVSETLSSVLSNSSEEFALDRFILDEELSIPTQTAIAQYNNDGIKWMYADFKMAYDPCSCFYRSGMLIQVFLIDESVITLSGAIEGTITTIEDGETKVKENGFSFDGLLKSGKKAAKSYSSVNKFVKQQLEVIDVKPEDTPESLESEGKIDAANTVRGLGTLGTLFNGSKILKGGLKAVPFIAAGLDLVNFFTGGGKSGPQTVKVMPMAIQADVTLDGSLIATYPFSEINFNTPGSKNVKCLDESQYPYYNEVLGVFNLIKTPNMYERVSRGTTIGDPGGEPDMTWTRFNYRLAEDEIIQYVINPASDLRTNGEILACIEVEFDWPHSIFWEPDKLIKVSEKSVRTRYVPLGCLGQLAIRGTTRGHKEVKAYIKFVMNLEKENASPDDDNVLLVTKYPVKIVGADYSQLPIDYMDGTLTGFENELTLNYTVNGTLGAWEKVLIDTSYNVEDAQISAGESIDVEPGTTIRKSSFKIALPNGCNSSSRPLNGNEITSFCQSALYNTTERNNFSSRASLFNDELVNNPVESEKKIHIKSIYPNPTNEKFTISYNLQVSSKVRITLTDFSGTVVVKDLIQDLDQTKGVHTKEIDVSELKPGIYICVFETNNQIERNKIMIF